MTAAPSTIAEAPGDPRAALEKLLRRQDLARSEASALACELVADRVAPALVAAILVALRAKGESVAELLGFVDALSAVATRVELEGPLLDTCGTGGDGQGSFNVSTAAAVVAASLGARVAKHGNRSVSSRSGSSDVLGALGARIDLEPAAVCRCVRTVGLGFLFAPRFHPAFRAVADVRRALGVRTIFNLLGPLLNPAPITHQLVGVMAPEWIAPIAAVLQGRGRARALVVHGDGFDEVATTGPTTAALVSFAGLRSLVLTPEALGLARADRNALAGGSADENAATMRAILAGRRGPITEAVAASAGVALHVFGAATSAREGVEQSLEAMGDGRASRTLSDFIDATRSEP